jgi:hypothetical protein
VLDVEVLWIVENSDLLIGANLWLVTIWRDRDSREIDLRICATLIYVK